MRHNNRALLAIIAMLGLALSSFAFASPANAGHQNDSTFDTTTLSGTGPQSGTLPNGVDWSVDKGTGPNVQGYYIGTGDGVQTYTFSEPVTLEFGVAGLNCGGEAIRFQAGINAVDINANHSWNPGTQTVIGAGASTSDTSFFASSGPVTSFTIQAIGAAGCGRGVASFEVGYFDNETPTASVAAPVNGGEFTQGQTVLADYSCADADTVHVDSVTCVGDVADGDPIDTSTTGSHSFTVTATDEHGATSDQTVNYTVKDQAGMCTGTGIGLPLNLNLGTANPQAVPCATAKGNLVNLNLSLGTLPFPLTALSPSLSVKVANADTEKAGNTHRASASVDEVKLSMPLNSFSLNVTNLLTEVEASVPVSCAAGADLKGHSEFGRVILNGKQVSNTGYDQLSLPIPLLGGVHFNAVSKSGSAVGAKAFFLDLPGTLLDVSLASSAAGVDC